MKRIITLLVLVLGLGACGEQAEPPRSGQAEPWEALQAVESYIEARPDSALQVLRQMDAKALRGREKKALYALYMSMALDKNYIDTTDFAVLQPAIDYYPKKGTPTEKLRTYFYQGRIYQNAGNDGQALECFVKALDEGARSNDIRAKARTYHAKSNIHYKLYEWDAYIEGNQKAAELYKEAGKDKDYASCMIRLINGYTQKGDSAAAVSYIKECQRLAESMDIGRLGFFYSSYLTYVWRYGSKIEMEQVLDEYIKILPSSEIEWLTVANVYVELGKYEKALQVMPEFEDLWPNSEKKYYIVFSKIYEHLGQSQKSLEHYKEYVKLSGQEDMLLVKDETKFVEEKYNLENSVLKEKSEKRTVLFLASLCLMLSIVVILVIHYRLRMNKMEKEKYHHLYLQVEEEKEDLSKVLAENPSISLEAKTALAARLALLNRYMVAQISENGEMDRQAQKQIDSLIAQKDTFMQSTRQAFEASHPNFIAYLKTHHLTEEEIEYTCLYALGLKGKEIGLYLKKPSHYNMSSDIRTKLGINEHDTNLGIYIRKLLAKF